MCLYPLQHYFVCVSGDFLCEPHVYEDLQDMKALKVFMETQLEDYNQMPGVVPMRLVLFRDAIEHSASASVHDFPCLQFCPVNPARNAYSKKKPQT